MLLQTNINLLGFNNILIIIKILRVIHNGRAHEGAGGYGPMRTKADKRESVDFYCILRRDGLKAVLSRQRRGKAAMSLTEARQGRGRELEAEARQTKFEARPMRGRVKSTLFVSF